MAIPGLTICLNSDGFCLLTSKVSYFLLKAYIIKKKFFFFKVKFKHLNNDLVNSYHLLLCCINLIYLNLKPLDEDDNELKSYKKNLLLVKIEVGKQQNNFNLLIDYLCKNFDGEPIETKTINEHYFKPQLMNLNEKHIFGLKYVDKHNPSSYCLNLIDLKRRNKFKACLKRLNNTYDSYLLQQNTSTKCSSINCLDLVYSYDIDDRMFININDQFNSNSNENNTQASGLNTEDELNNEEFDQDDETDSHNSSFVTTTYADLFLDKIKLPASLVHLSKLNKFDLEQELKLTFQMDNFDLVEKLTCLFKTSLLTEFNLKHNDLSQATTSEHCRKRRKTEKAPRNYQYDNILKLIDNLFDLVFIFYLKTVHLMLNIEKNRVEVTGGNLNKLISNETFNKSIYVCCFEIIFNFCTIACCCSMPYSINSTTATSASTTTHSLEDTEISIEHIKISNYLTQLTSLPINDKFTFSFNIHLANLNEYYFFQIIESFIKSTTTDSSVILSILDRDMIKHLNGIEEKIIEHLGWLSESPVWSKLDLVKINETYSNNFLQANNNAIHLLIPFPLYDDVLGTSNISNNNGSTQIISSTSILNNAVSGSGNNNSNNNDIIINVTPNLKTSSSNSISSSPVKHPAITRVVCSSDTPRINAISGKQIQILSSSMNSATKQMPRLNHLNTGLMLFFRKFYNLANLRIRDLVDKLDLVNIALEAHNESISVIFFASISLFYQIFNFKTFLLNFIELYYLIK